MRALGGPSEPNTTEVGRAVRASLARVRQSRPLGYAVATTAVAVTLGITVAVDRVVPPFSAVRRAPGAQRPDTGAGVSLRMSAATMSTRATASNGFAMCAW